MPIYEITLPQLPSGAFANNVSLQAGDTLYIARTVNDKGGKNHHATSTNTKPKRFGTVVGVGSSKFEVNDNFCSGCSITNSHYLMFSKNRRVNTSGIIGYYAQGEFRNHSTLPAEIFAAAVDFAESSK